MGAILRGCNPTVTVLKIFKLLFNVSAADMLYYRVAALPKIGMYLVLVTSIEELIIISMFNLP